MDRALRRSADSQRANDEQLSEKVGDNYIFLPHRFKTFTVLARSSNRHRICFYPVHSYNAAYKRTCTSIKKTCTLAPVGRG